MCTRNVQSSSCISKFMATHYLLGKVSKRHSHGLCSYQSFLNITHAFEFRNVLELMGFSLKIHVRLNQIQGIEQQNSSYLEDDAYVIVLPLYTFSICTLCSHVPVPGRAHHQPRKSQKHNDIIESLIYTHAFGIVCFNSLHFNILYICIFSNLFSMYFLMF